MPRRIMTPKRKASARTVRANSPSSTRRFAEKTFQETRNWYTTFPEMVGYNRQAIIIFDEYYHPSNLLCLNTSSLRDLCTKLGVKVSGTAFRAAVITAILKYQIPLIIQRLGDQGIAIHHTQP